MRVMLDTTFAARAQYSGTAIYLQCLQEVLARQGEIEVVQACNARRPPPAGGGAGSVRNLLVDRWWTAVELPRLARAMRAELIHHPLPATALINRVPQVVTVHDLAFERLPECFDRGFRVYAHLNHRAAALAADAVICVSETTAADVEILWGVPPERIVVARHGPGQEPGGMAGGRAWPLPGGMPARTLGGRSPAEPEHFLYVGDDEPRKNVSMLLAAYRGYRERSQAPLALVLAGRAGGVAWSRARGPGRGRVDDPGVRIERDPGAERLAQLYAGAAALIQPSLYEGFGLTALEAMSAGTPVLAASSPGLVEVCGDGARYADARDPASFAAAMSEIAASKALRVHLAARGRASAARFSWESSARAHLDAYSLALRR